MCRYSNILNPRSRIEMQLKDWLEGVSFHNDTDNCCVPDYSCCYPTLEVPVRTRQLYIQFLGDVDDAKSHDLAIQMEAMFRGNLMILGGQTVVCNDAPYDLSAYH